MKESIGLLCLYVSNVLAIAIPLAIFEIWLEKLKTGWGGEFRSPFWGKKIYFGFLLKIAEKTYVTTYHLVMFGLVLPSLLAIEFFILWHLSKDGFWILNVDGIRFVPVIFLPTVWLGNTVVEDFFYFVFNWRFPGALKKLFRGEMTWHTHYTNLTSSVKLPRFYITYSICVFVLLVAQYILVRLF